MSEEVNAKNNGLKDSPTDTEATKVSTDPLQEALAAVEKYKNDFMYLRADFENYKKGAIKERSDLVKFGSERLITEILGALDNFDRAFELPISSENYQNFVKGMELTRKELRGGPVQVCASRSSG